MPTGGSAGSASFEQKMYAGVPKPQPPAPEKDPYEDFYKFAQEQWRRQMEGLGQSSAALDPSRSTWNMLYGNNTPGALEQAWSQYGSRFMQPTQSSAALGDYRSYLNQPSYSQGAYGEARGYLQGPTQSSTAYLNNQLSGPSQSANTFGFYGNQLRGTGEFENWATGAGQRQLSAPGSGEDWYSRNRNAYDGVTNQQNLYASSFGRLNAPSETSQFYKDFVDNMEGRDQARLMYNQAGQSAGKDTYMGSAAPEIQGYIRGSDDLQQFGARNMGTFENRGLYENLTASVLQGNDPMLDRMRQKSEAALNQQFARRGHFSSGGAMEALGNMYAEMDAREFDKKAEMAKGSQQLELARLGQGQGLAQGIGQHKLAQGGALQSLAKDRSQEAQGQARLDLDALRGADDTTLANNQLAASLAGRSDDTMRANLQALAGMAQGADSSYLAQTQAGQDAAYRNQDATLARLAQLGGVLSDGQKLSLERMGLGMNAAGQVDSTSLARALGNFNMAQGTDASNLARAQGIFGMGQGMDATSLARFGMLGNLAQGADGSSLDALNSYFRNAGATQGAQGERARDTFGSRFDMDSLLAKLTGSAYGTGGQLSGNAQLAGLGAREDFRALMKRLEAEEPGLFDIMAPLLGAGIGGLAGGPAGAVAGAKIGSSVG